jgi:hypothetical protein
MTHEQAYSLGKMRRDEVQSIVGENFMEYARRDEFTKPFGWSLPCLEAVETIRKYSRQPLHDPLAGSGYWSILLNEEGIKTIPADIHLPTRNHYHRKPPRRTRIKRRNLLRLAHDMMTGRLKGDILLSWPPYMSPAPARLLRMIPKGTRIFYIGEGWGGCTADDSFHETLERDFRRLHREQLPNWPGIHDSLEVWEK